jgi:hypothetical protein
MDIRSTKAVVTNIQATSPLLKVGAVCPKTNVGSVAATPAHSNPSPNLQALTLRSTVLQLLIDLSVASKV